MSTALAVSQRATAAGTAGADNRSGSSAARTMLCLVLAATVLGHLANESTTDGSSEGFHLSASELASEDSASSASEKFSSVAMVSPVFNCTNAVP
jgi:hypothetical protein